MSRRIEWIPILIAIGAVRYSSVLDSASVTEANLATGLRVWEDLLKQLGDDYRWSQMPFHPAYTLLSDAFRSYDASAFQAACAMCRAAAEAACYIFLTRRYDMVPGGTGKAWLIEFPKDLSGKPRDVTFDELLSGIRERNLLTHVEVKALQRIQREGNFAVHAAARQDRDLHRMVPGPPGSWRATSQGLVPTFKTWASKEHAYRNVIDSARIIGKLVKAAGPWPGSANEGAGS